MCEFCSGPCTLEHGRDQQDTSFAGFFSSDAIDAAYDKQKVVKEMCQGQGMTRRRSVKKTMIQMVPSINLPGGGDRHHHQSGVATAFVSTPLLLQRQRTSISNASSIGSSIPLEDDSFLRGGDSYQQQDKKLQRVARQDEPNLYNIPSNLHPTYQPIPFVIQLLIAIISASIGRVGLSTFISISHKWMFKQLLKSIEVLSIAKATSFLLRTALLSTIAKLSIQEVFYMPSRVTTRYLVENDELPSRLSRYTEVQPVPVSSPTKEELTTSTSWNDDSTTTSTPSSIGVHSIQYKQQNQSADTTSSKHKKYDGIYLHHGFGASSLSWLPVLPSLVQQIGSSKCIGVAHDAPGFGFTDRPNANVDGGLYQYGFENNVGIGIALMNDVLDKQESQYGSAVDKAAKSVALFGHSMGSKSTLLQALYYAKHPELNVKPNLVVLVAPALEGATLPSRKTILSSSSNKSRVKKEQSMSSSVRKLATRVWLAWRKIFVDYPFQFGLRRLVSGSKDFWRKGLALAWGNANKLSDSDVLRFQWPSIGQGWEEGLINFTRARILSSPIPSQHMLDEELLAEVANLKDTQVVIVYGSNDKVVRIEGSVAAKLKIDYPNIKLIRAEGSGHDPFEEDVDGFMMELEKAIK